MDGYVLLLIAILIPIGNCKNTNVKRFSKGLKKGRMWKNYGTHLSVSKYVLCAFIIELKYSS